MKKAGQQNRVAIPLPFARKNNSTRPTPTRSASPAITPINSSGASAKAQSDDGAEPAVAEVAGTAPAPTRLLTAEEPHHRHSVQTPVSSDTSSLPLTNRATPNALLNGVSSQSAATTNAMPDNFSPPPSAGPDSTRTPSDTFDMRHIRTELPPPFVPSAGQHTPQSALSPHSHPRQQPPRLPHAHPNNLSSSGIVFGGIDSVNSSPGPPPNLSSPFAPPQYPPPTPYSHAHHASEPHPPRMSQSGFYQQPPSWGMRQAFAPAQSAYHPHAHMPARPAPREGQRQGSGSRPNGSGTRSRSDSQSSALAQTAHRELQSPVGLDQPIDSSRAMFHDPRPTFPPPPRQFPPHTPHGSQHFPHPDVATTFDNAEAMRSHVFSNFENAEFADCHLHITEENGPDGQGIDGHTIVLARSPRLLDIIRKSASLENGLEKTQLRIVLPGRHTRVSAFIEALRYLYGGPLPPFEHYALGPQASAEDRLQQALQYIATGAWLKLTPFAHRGVEIASNLLQWTTVTTVLEFVLLGGLSQTWTVDDGSEERTSTCSSDDSLTKPEAGGQPAYDPYATALLTRVLDFMAHNFPPNFYLDSAAPQSTACPRLPAQAAKHESRPSRSDPRLSKIRFGEHPVEDHSRPSTGTTTLSSILLSLPFPLLKYLLEHPVLPGRLGAETVASIMRQVVHEREIRRQRTLKGRAANQNTEDSEPHLVQNLYWEESVEFSSLPLHQAGFRLARRRRGIATPPTHSGVENEQTK
ncbi:uncharacterized protein MYCFIDRAFT_83181 [Pseudocercospora fijiensis CIRAD86]|uniref:BTB domain-containing protein n=1 Tax=Pseudocercospora fijiensis (strain CIRAD86) TaxID=383855 RepID=M2YHC5_PSEFD|nr:uncharacterized protein MYCFIDRAFT_83181 [Pseudocercospora fijiensis CIRAD86]EME77225.1 hypothetical protein MYCFIDRAFT_83181 [Pseudocercospora fijiensis CIRAD86]